MPASRTDIVVEMGNRQRERERPDHVDIGL